MPIIARSSNGRAIRAGVTVERDARAWELHTAGMNVREIAAHLQIAVGTAQDAITRGGQMIMLPEAIEGKKAELAELQAIRRTFRAIMAENHPKVDHGRTIYLRDPANPEGTPTILYDKTINLRAGLALINAQVRRARLMGWDAPAQIRIEVVPEETVDAEIRRLEAKLSQNDPKESVES